MRPFDELTPRGQRARVREIARSAAHRYGHDGARLTFVSQSFNTVFRLRTAEGGDYLLRVGAALRLHPEGSEAVEEAWLNALGRDTTVAVARAYRNLDHKLVTVASSPAVPGARRCVLFSWVPGRTLVGRLDAELAARSGRLLAELHTHACQWALLPAPSVSVADRVLYWRDEPRLEAGAPRYRSLFLDATERAQGVIEGLWAAPAHRPHLLHGDLTPSNIVQTRRGLVPIDFQDLVWGFDVQDVASSLLPFRRYQAATVLTDAFRTAYATVRPWPEFSGETLTALFAARRLLMVNLALNLRRPGVDGYVDHHAAELAAWMGR